MNTLAYINHSGIDPTSEIGCIEYEYSKCEQYNDCKSDSDNSKLYSVDGMYLCAECLTDYLLSGNPDDLIHFEGKELINSNILEILNEKIA